MEREETLCRGRGKVPPQAQLEESVRASLERADQEIQTALKRLGDAASLGPSSEVLPPGVSFPLDTEGRPVTVQEIGTQTRSGRDQGKVPPQAQLEESVRASLERADQEIQTALKRLGDAASLGPSSEVLPPGVSFPLDTEGRPVTVQEIGTQTRSGRDQDGARDSSEKTPDEDRSDPQPAPSTSEKEETASASGPQERTIPIRMEGTTWSGKEGAEEAWNIHRHIYVETTQRTCIYQAGDGSTAKPPSMQVTIEDVQVQAGETAKFQAIIEGHPQPTVTWYQGSTLLTNSPRVSQEQEGTNYSLILKDITQQDAGIYTCLARNTSGEVLCKAELLVQGGEAEPGAERQSYRRKLHSFYEVKEEIGRGAFGFVKRVEHKGNKVSCAAKFIPLRTKTRAQAYRERDILATLNHELVTQLLDEFETRKTLILILELCSSEELLDRLYKKNVVTETEVKVYIKQILEGLKYLHDNDILHLDIKPPNILMAHPSREDIKICDFGFAQKITPSEPQYSKFGSPEFVSPEIIAQTPVMTTSDIWAVGVITYLSLTCTSPFAGENDRATLLNVREGKISWTTPQAVHLSEEAKDFIKGILQPAPEARPSASKCLTHSWFMKPSVPPEEDHFINTKQLKFVVARSRWQRSLMCYKSILVMQSIPELLQGPSDSPSLGISRHLIKEASYSTSSSSSDNEIAAYSRAKSLPPSPGTYSPVLPPKSLLRSSASLPEEGELSAGATGTSRGTDHRWEHSGQLPPRAPQRFWEQPQLLKTASADSVTFKEGESETAGVASSQEGDRTAAKGATCVPRQSVIKSTFSWQACEAAEREGTSPVHDYRKHLERARRNLLKGWYSKGALQGLREPLLEHYEMEEEEAREAQVGPLTKSSSFETALRLPGSTSRVSNRSHSFDDYRLRTSSPFPELSEGKEQSKDPATSDTRGSHSAAGESPKISQSESPGGTTIPLAPAKEQEIMAGAGSPSQGASLPASSTQKEERSVLKARPPLPKSSGSKVTGTCQEGQCPTSSVPHSQMALSSPWEDSSLRSSNPFLLSDSITTLQGGNHPLVPTPNLQVVPGSATEDRQTDGSLKHSNPFLSSDLGPSSFPATGSGPSAFTSNEGGHKDGSLKRSNPFLYSDTGSALQEGNQLIGIPGDTFKRSNPFLYHDPGSALSEGSAAWDTAILQKQGTPSSALPGTHMEGLLKTCSYLLPGQSQSADSPRPSVFQTQTSPFTGSVSAHHGYLGSAFLGDISPSEAAPGLTSKSEYFYSATESVSLEDVVEKMVDLSKEMTVLADSVSDQQGPQAQSVSRKFSYGERGGYVGVEGYGSFAFGGEGNVLGQRPLWTARTWTESISSEEPEETVQSETKSASLPEIVETGKDAGKEIGKDARKEVRKETGKGSGEFLSWEEFGKSSQVSLVQIKDLSEDSSTGDRVSLDISEVEPAYLNLSDLYDIKYLPFEFMIFRKVPKPVEKEVPAQMEVESLERTDLEEAWHKQEEFGLFPIRATGQQRSLEIMEDVDPMELMSKDTKGLMDTRRKKRKSSPTKPGFFNFSGKYQSLDSPVEHSLKKKVKASVAHISRILKGKPAFEQERREVLGEEEAFKKKSGLSSFRLSGMKTKDRAPLFVKELTDEAVIPGQSVTLSCQVSAHPAPQTEWFKDGIPIQTSGRLLISSTLKNFQLLTILVVTEEDLGVYKCTVSNSLGMASTIGVIRKAEIPSCPPRPDIGEIYENGVLLVWKPVESHSPVTYIVQCKIEGGDWITLASDIFDCCYYANNLSHGGMYSFRTACVSKAGMGPYSSSSERIHIGDHNQMGPAIIPDVFPGATKEKNGKAIQTQPLSSQQTYAFQMEIRRGRFSVVRQCREKSSGRVMAAKIIPYHPEDKLATVREYEVLKAIHHPNIAQLFGAYISPRHLVLILEFCAGPELLHCLAERATYSEMEVKDYLWQILSATEFLHANHILHLDLRSENMIVTEYNLLKILDFGNAQFYTQDKVLPTEKFKDYIETMAPELLEGYGAIPQTDVWAIGVTAFIMLSAEYPVSNEVTCDLQKGLRKGKIKLNRCYAGLSGGAVSFLQSTLCANPWGRPCVSSCLQCPWLTKEGLEHTQQMSVTFSTNRLRTFMKEREKKRALLYKKHNLAILH